MDIIKHGKYNKQQYRIICERCGCVFTYSQHDRHGYDGIFRNEFVTCPECNKWNEHRNATIIIKVESENHSIKSDKQKTC